MWTQTYTGLESALLGRSHTGTDLLPLISSWFQFSLPNREAKTHIRTTESHRPASAPVSLHCFYTLSGACRAHAGSTLANVVKVRQGSVETEHSRSVFFFFLKSSPSFCRKRLSNDTEGCLASCKQRRCLQGNQPFDWTNKMQMCKLPSNTSAAAT